MVTRRDYHRILQRRVRDALANVPCVPSMTDPTAPDVMETDYVWTSQRDFHDEIDMEVEQFVERVCHEFRDRVATWQVRVEPVCNRPGAYRAVFIASLGTVPPMRRP